MNEKNSKEEVVKINNEVIVLNIGGVLYTTNLSTIKQNIGGKGNFFTTLFNGSFELQRDKDGNIFIDRNGKIFEYIIKYIRSNGGFFFIKS
jgi:hypothetical protein